jgi:hypothetical protein
MSDQHARFQDRVRGSRQAVFLVARWQHELGRTVEVPPLRVAPTAAEHENYIDDGDLFAFERHRIEVKHLDTDFSCAEDWPYQHFFVGRTASVDRAHDAKIFALVSRDLRYRAVVNIKETRPKWYPIEAVAHNTGNRERYYCCPIELVKFEAFPPEWL